MLSIKIQYLPSCRAFFLFSALICVFACNLSQVSAQASHVKIGEKSTAGADIQLKLVARIQRNHAKPKSKTDFYDEAINSPKSALILENIIKGKKVKKLYVNSLEGCMTAVYDMNNKFKKLTVIHHNFKAKDAALFKETDFPGYTFKTRKTRFNIFKGRPVEMTLSNNDRYLWVPYYRRDYDRKAIDPSAVAIIDVLTDKIVRVMPTAPLPKMVSSSPDNKYVAIINWGDNTVHLIDISSGDPSKFQYISHFVVGKKLNLNFGAKVNRDNTCGYCLRGTVFTPDSNYLLVGRMGGGGIAIFDLKTMKYLGSVFGMKTNVRHLIIFHEYLYLSSNQDGMVQRTNWKEMLTYFAKKGKNCRYKKWESVFTGKGARTIACTLKGKYLFATANDESKISILRTEDMKVIGYVKADSYPVGMAIDHINKYLVVTAQGKKDKHGGNSVMIYEISKTSK